MTAFFVIKANGADRFYGLNNSPTGGKQWEWGPLDKALRFARRVDAELLVGFLPHWPVGAEPTVVQREEADAVR